MNPPTIEATGLVRSYGKLRALDGMELTTTPGVTGLLGPNGAGKTTLLRVLATVSSFDAGPCGSSAKIPATPRPAPHPSVARLPAAGGRLPPGFTAFEAIDYVAVLKEHTATRRGTTRCAGSSTWSGWATSPPRRCGPCPGG